MQIEIDFDVWKAITQLRQSEDMTENEVLRGILLADTISINPSVARKSEGLTVDGVTFPDGTKIRKVLRETTDYGKKGDIFLGVVQDGFFIVNGKRYSSPTAAAQSITVYGVNGWRFWECQFPSTESWITLDDLPRNSKQSEDKS